MKRPVSQTHRRPRMAAPRVTRTRKEAAIDLVRLEFDAERLDSGVRQALGRACVFQEELARNRAQRARLLDLISR